MVQHLGDSKDVATLVQIWKMHVTFLLNYLCGRAFTFVGGIEVQIAKYIRNAAYLECIKMGPLLSGPIFSHSINSYMYYNDDLVGEDFDMLLGTVSPALPQNIL